MIFTGIFGHQNLDIKDQFRVFANGLVRALTPALKDMNLTGPIQYNIGGVQGATLYGDELRELPNPTPCKDEIIPDPDSIPLSILNYPLGKRQEIDFAAYDSPGSTHSPMEEAYPVLVAP